MDDPANLYANTERFQEAETASGEGLEIRRALARENPAADRPDLAQTLNNLAIFHRATQRFKEADAAEQEPQMIKRG